MNDTQTHFAAVCPHCSTALKIRRALAGQPVRCKHCDNTFVAKDADAPGAATSVEVDASSSTPTSSQSERIAIACPNCHTALSVRRIYIGRSVRCKNCDETVLVADPSANDLPTVANRSAPPETDGKVEALQAEISLRNQELQAAHDRLQAELDLARSVQDKVERLSSENEELQAANARLQADVDRLSAESQRLRDEHDAIQASQAQDSSETQQLRSALDRIRPEHDRLLRELDHATTELEAIRAALGGIAPADVGPLAEERAVLTAEVDRLKEEMERYRLEGASGESEREATEREGNFAREEVDRLTELLKRREGDLESARAEQERLGRDQQGAWDEIEQLRSTLAERERDMRSEGDRLHGESDQLRIEGDQLRNEIDSLRRDLADTEQGRQDAIGRIEAQLAGLAETHRQVQEQYEAAERSCQEHQDRNQELRADLDRLQSASPAPASQDELQAACAEVESLKRQLVESERIQQEMRQMMSGIGITFREV